MGCGGSDARVDDLLERHGHFIDDLINAYANDEFEVDSLGFAVLASMMRILWSGDHFNDFVNRIGMYKYLILIKNMGPMKEKEACRAIQAAVREVDYEEEFSQRGEALVMAMDIDDKTIQAIPFGSTGNGYEFCVKEKQKPGKPKNIQTKQLSHIVIERAIKNRKDRTEEAELLDQMPKCPYTIHHTHESAYVVMYNIPGLVFNNTHRRNLEKSKDRKLWMVNFPKTELGEATFKEAVKKPMFWKRSIEEALTGDKDKSLMYDLSVVPCLLNACITQSGTPLHWAVQHASVKYITALCDLGAKTDVENGKGKLPLHLADKPHIARELVRLGVDLTARDKDGFTVLESSTAAKNMEMVQQLLEFDVDIREPNPDGRYWLSWSMRNKHLTDANYKKIMSILKERTQAPYHADKNFETVFKIAVASRQADLYESVVNRDMDRVRAHMILGTDMHISGEQKDCDMPLAIYCAQNGLTDILRVFLVNGMQKDICNNRKENTFRVAVEAKQWETAKLLLENGVEINDLADDGLTVLHSAYNKKDNELINFCLECGCNPNIKNGEKKSVCFIAFLDRNDEIAELIQDKYKGDINSQDGDGQSLLHMEVINGDMDRMKYLISRGIKLDIENSWGRTPLTHAVSVMERYDMGDMLIEAGSDINYITSGSGKSQIMIVADSKYFSIDILQWFLDHGADANIRSKGGNYLLSILISKGRDEAAQLLLDTVDDLVISDESSSLEPIVAALQVSSQEWFEKLVARGATAGNRSVGVISLYLKTDWFDIEVLQEMETFNRVTDSPLPLAMSMGRKDVVEFLWDDASERERVSIANGTGPKGMTLLMWAAKDKWMELIDELVDSKYDLKIQDCDGKNAGMHLAEHGHKSHVEAFYNIVGVKVAGMTDKSKWSLLTYVCEQKWKDLANTMFTDDISLDCREDHNGIISNFISIVREIALIQKKAKENAAKAKEYLDKWQKAAKEADAKVKKAASQVESFQNLYDQGVRNGNPHQGYLSKIEYYRGEMARSQKVLDKAMSNAQQCSKVYDVYQDKLRQANSITRADGLRNLNSLYPLAHSHNDLSGLLLLRS